MKRSSLKIGLFFAASLALGTAAFTTHRALAQEGFGHGAKAAMVQHMIGKRIDEALDAAKVNDKQRQAVHEIRDRTFQKVLAQHNDQDRGAEMERALSLFTGDRIDPNELQAIRAKHEVQMKQVGDAITEALTEVHDLLTPVQRKAVADYVRTHHSHGHGQN